MATVDSIRQTQVNRTTRRTSFLCGRITATEEPVPGEFLPLNHTLRGRISYSRGEYAVAFVIDGKSLTRAQFAKMVEMYEGWQFRLDFFDVDEEDR